MRRLALGMTTAASLFLGLHGQGMAQGRQDFTLVNRTGSEIEELHISPTSSNDWGPDILGQDELGDGESAQIRFAPGNSECNWDIKVVFDDEDSAQWRGVNLCQISRITLYWDRAAGTTRAVAE